MGHSLLHVIKDQVRAQNVGVQKGRHNLSVVMDAALTYCLGISDVEGDNLFEIVTLISFVDPLLNFLAHDGDGASDSILGLDNRA